MRLSDVDFAQLYREQMARSGRARKPASAWDERARKLRGRMTSGTYAADFIARMDLEGVETLLDVGCGPGTIGVPLARRLRRVYGLDYSPMMLEVLMENAVAHGVDNVVPVLRAWEDDWSDLPRCDIAVASRSTAVEDMAAAIEKLNAHARKRVYMTTLVGGQFVDPEIAALLGRRQEPFPDYIYVVNILYSMGIHPRLDYIELPSRLAGTRDFAEFAERVAWSFGELQPEELERLRQWYAADPERSRRGGAPMRWALIDWEPPP